MHQHKQSSGAIVHVGANLVMQNNSEIWLEFPWLQNG